MQIEAWQFGMALVVFLLGCLGTALRIGYLVASAIAKINEQMASMKAEFNALLELKEAENGKAIGRVYERFDEYKEHLENRFVSKELCGVMHTTNTTSLANLDKKIDDLSKKVDSLLMRG